MSTLIIKLDGVEVAMVNPGLSTTVINLSTPRRDQMGFRMSQIMTGLVCLIFCWTSPSFIGIWTGIPFILTGVFYIVSERKALPGWMYATTVTNVLSLLLAIGGVIAYAVEWNWNPLRHIVLAADLVGMFGCLQTLIPLRRGSTSTQMVQDMKPLLDTQPPEYEEKSPSLNQV